MNEHQQLIADLLVTVPFRLAIDEAVGKRMSNGYQAMRTAARAGDVTRAAWFEGQLCALEDTLSMLESYARREQKQS